MVNCPEAQNLAANLSNISANRFRNNLNMNDLEGAEDTIGVMQHLLASMLQAIQTCERGE